MRNSRYKGEEEAVFDWGSYPAKDCLFLFTGIAFLPPLCILLMENQLFTFNRNCKLAGVKEVRIMRQERTLLSLEMVRLRQQCEAVQQAKARLQGNETLYRFLAEQSTDVIWRLDEQLQFTYVSPAVTRVFGYLPEEVTGDSLVFRINGAFR